MRANARTGADLELGGRAILQLYRIPHVLEGDSLDLLVDVVDSLIFGLLSLVTARNGDCRRELREAGKLVASVLEECCEENRGAMLGGCLDTLAGAIINTNLPVWLRTICIKGLNALLERSKKEKKSLVWEKLNAKLEALFSFLLACGIYDTQAAVVELICRILPKVERQKTAEAMISDQGALQLFLKIGGNFEANCRVFLNRLNLSLGLKCKVFPIPIVACTVDGHCFFKPDETDFWVDFNMGKEDRGLSFYSMEKEGSEEPWHLEIINQEDVLEVNVSVPGPKTILVSITKSGGGLVQLNLDSSQLHQILKILLQLFGDRLKDHSEVSHMSKTESSSTPKKTLLLSKEGKSHSPMLELPENTSIPPSEEEGDPASLPCAQGPHEQPVQVVESPKLNEQIRTYTRQPREEKKSRGELKVATGKSTPRSKVGGHAKSYSPVVTVGEAQMGVKAKKKESLSSDRGVKKKVEKAKPKVSEQPHSGDATANALVGENVDQTQATPEMVGGPGVREDVTMTRSGGRKRAVRKIPESSRQKMQNRAKPTQLDFQNEVTVSRTELDVTSARLVNNKSGACDEASTSRGRKTAQGLKKILGNVPKALCFGKNISKRCSVSPTLGDISEISARGFKKGRKSSALGAGREKRRKLGEISEGAANQRGAGGEPMDTNSNSLRISRTVSQGRVKVRSTGHEAEVKSKNGVSVSSSMEVGDSCQKKGGEYQDEIHDECPENQPSQTRRICEPALEGDDDFDKLLNSDMEIDHEEERRRDEIRTEREAKEREAELVTRLSRVEEEGERLGQEVARLAASRQELTIRRKESKMAGEQLMRLLETLDGISLDQNMFELRARRKKAAGRINSLMDTNDSNIQVGIQKQHDAVLS